MVGVRVLGPDSCELGFHDCVRHSCRVATPSEHSDQFSRNLVSFCTDIGSGSCRHCQVAAPLMNKFCCPCPLVLGVYLIESVESILIADTFGTQFDAQGPLAFARVGMA